MCLTYLIFILIIHVEVIIFIAIIGHIVYILMLHCDFLP